MPSPELIASTLERRGFWRVLKSLAGASEQVDANQIANQVRTEMAQKIAAQLLGMVDGGSAAPLLDAPAGSGDATQIQPPATAANAAVEGDYEAVWIDSPECTACDECIMINPKIFAYNDNKQATVINPQGGSYKDIVRAAEKCSVSCIHPGTPFNPNEKDLDKLVKRAEKYQ